MKFATFAEVKTAFASDATVDAFQCLQRDCDNGISQHQKEEASRLLAQAEIRLDGEILRDIYCCLLCRRHQKSSYGYNVKNKLEAQWSLELPDVAWAARRHPSRYSLVSSDMSPSERRASSASQDQRRLTTPDSNHNRGSSVPCRHDSPLARPVFAIDEGTPGQHTPLFSSRRGSPAGRMDDVELHSKDFDDESSGSPIILRRQRSKPSSGHNDYLGSMLDLSGPSVDERRLVDSSDDVGTLSDNLNAYESRMRSRPSPGLPEPEPCHVQALVTEDDYDVDMEEPAGHYMSGALPALDLGTGPADDPPFYLGRASTWAPATIRKEVFDLLREPIPKPTDKGSIYAVRVRDTPYVKIGITTRKVDDRLREIDARIRQQHHLGLDWDSRQSRGAVPLLELYRLERIVHADLAYSQRDLYPGQRLQRQKGAGTMHEFFEIDLPSALDRIDFWMQAMDTLNLKPGGTINGGFLRHAQAEAEQLDRFQLPSAVANDAAKWKKINADQSSRAEDWRLIFRTEEGGYSAEVWPRFSYWLLGIVALWATACHCWQDWDRRLPSMIILELGWLAYWKSWHMPSKGWAFFLKVGRQRQGS